MRAHPCSQVPSRQKFRWDLTCVAHGLVMGPPGVAASWTRDFGLWALSTAAGTSAMWQTNSSWAVWGLSNSMYGLRGVDLVRVRRGSYLGFVIIVSRKFAGLGFGSPSRALAPRVLPRIRNNRFP